MTQGVWSLGAVVLAGWLCWQAAVDVRADPPAVACVGDWVAGCERVEGGLRFRVEAGAPDLAFTFVGLGEDVALGYWVEDGAGARLAFGAGTSVPLGAWQEARGVRFFALSGDADWAEVEAVGAEAAGEEAAARKEVPGGPGGGGAAARAARGRRTLAGADGFAIYEAVSRTATQVGSDPETGETVISTFKVSALNDICSAGEVPYGENAFSVSVEGQVLVYGGGADPGGGGRHGGCVGGGRVLLGDRGACLHLGALVGVVGGVCGVGGGLGGLLDGGRAA